MADKHNEEAKTIRNYLIMYCRKYAGDKLNEKLFSLLEKPAKKLGVSTFHNLIAGNFPAQKLATYAADILKVLYYQGHYDASYVKGHPGTNPFDPIENEDAYVEYLLYSWALGNPGYVYDNVKDYGPLGRHPTSNW